MPDGKITRFNASAESGSIESSTGRFTVRADDMEANARVEGAFVTFDVQRDSPMDRAVNVRLRRGTRNNPSQSRFGDTGNGGKKGGSA